MSISSRDRGVWYDLFPLNLHPLAAFLIVPALVLLSELLWQIEDLEIVFPLTTAIGAFVVLGYVVATAIRLASLFPDRVAVKRGKLLAAFGFVVLFSFVALDFVQLLVESGPAGRGLLLVVWPFVVAAPMYVCWVAARSLVSAEEGRRLTWDRNVGTFFLFYLFPIGILFIQMRLRRLLRTAAPEERPGAAG